MVRFPRSLTGVQYLKIGSVVNPFPDYYRSRGFCLQVNTRDNVIFHPLLTHKFNFGVIPGFCGRGICPGRRPRLGHGGPVTRGENLCFRPDDRDYAVRNGLCIGSIFRFGYLFHLGRDRRSPELLLCILALPFRATPLRSLTLFVPPFIGLSLCLSLVLHPDPITVGWVYLGYTLITDGRSHATIACGYCGSLMRPLAHASVMTSCRQCSTAMLTVAHGVLGFASWGQVTTASGLETLVRYHKYHLG